MTPESKHKLKRILVLHEGIKNFPYTDTTGNLTIGTGRNLTIKGISNIEALNLLDDDILFFSNELEKNLNFFSELDDVRQMALIDMCFNLGMNGFLEFKEMLKDFETKDYEKASEEILNSHWSSQVGERSKDIAYMVRTGNLMF